MPTFTDTLKQVLAALGYDDDEHDARIVLRLCDELGCAIEDLPAKYAAINAEADRQAAEDTERINRVLAMVDAGVTPLGVTAADIESFRAMARIQGPPPRRRRIAVGLAKSGLVGWNPSRPGPRATCKNTRSSAITDAAVC